MSDMSGSDSDPQLDAAVLSADKQRERYVLDRLTTRRKMAIIAFGQFVFGGAALVIGGLLMPSWAERIDHMGTFLSLYFATMGSIILAYWGIGAYERNTYGGMGNMGSTFSGGYGSGSSYRSNPAHPPLVKMPRAAG